jgi:heterotetrameric sarcosine oxidase gamma subunit
MAERTSALAGHYTVGGFGRPGDPGITLREVPGLVLHQISAWPETLVSVAAEAAVAAGLTGAPEPGTASVGTVGTLLRVEPLKWWIYGVEAPDLSADLGTTLDLSHARTHVRLSGPQAATCLNRHLPLDLRDAFFPVGTVASSALHHVGITLWRSNDGFDLFLPRGFALSTWEILIETAAQFGGEVK